MDDPLFEQMNQIRIQTVLNDLDLAVTFIQVARTSGNPDTRRRNRDNAAEAYSAIRDVLLPMCRINEAQRHDIEAKLTDLRRSLETLGEQIT